MEPTKDAHLCFALFFLVLRLHSSHAVVGGVGRFYRCGEVSNAHFRMHRHLAYTPSHFVLAQAQKINCLTIYHEAKLELWPRKLVLGNW